MLKELGPPACLTEEEGIYLFCFAQRYQVSEIDGSGPDERSPIFLIPFEDLVAVARNVVLEEYRGDSAEENLKDLTWLGPRARQHESVVEQVMLQSPVLPVQFATLFSSPCALRTLMEQHHENISDFLTTVSGHQEWAVKARLDRERARLRVGADQATDLEEELASLSPGRRYFEEQRGRTESEKRVSRWLKDTTGKLAAELTEVAPQTLQRKVYDWQTQKEEAVLNWAFLVPEGDVAKVHRKIHRANADHSSYGLTFELAGPWPPYSFVPSLANEPPVVTVQRSGQGPQRMA